MKATTHSQTSSKIAAFGAVERVRLGVSLALVALFTMGGIAFHAANGFLRSNNRTVCGVIGLTGLLLWIIGHLHEHSRAASAAGDITASEQKTATIHPLAFLMGFKSWGQIAVLSAGLVFAWGAFGASKPKLLPTPPPEVVSFPPLHLQGIIVNAGKSSAVINGQVLCLGEGIGSVQVVAIDERGVAVAMKGQTNILHLRE